MSLFLEKNKNKKYGRKIMFPLKCVCPAEVRSCSVVDCTLYSRYVLLEHDNFFQKIFGDVSVVRIHNFINFFCRLGSGGAGG